MSANAPALVPAAPVALGIAGQPRGSRLITLATLTAGGGWVGAAASAPMTGTCRSRPRAAAARKPAAARERDRNRGASKLCVCLACSQARARAHTHTHGQREPCCALRRTGEQKAAMKRPLPKHGLGDQGFGLLTLRSAGAGVSCHMIWPTHDDSTARRLANASMRA